MTRRASLGASFAAGALLALGLFGSLSFANGTHRPNVIAGGSGGVGGIPYAGVFPSPIPFHVPLLTTVGQVIDDAQEAMPDVPVIVMTSLGTTVAQGVTDDQGLFVVELPPIAGLTLSLPMNGVFDLPIKAGVPVLIVVP